MAATRTQVHLTDEQRRRIHQVVQHEGVTLAEVVRRALDAYFSGEHVDVGESLAATFGADPDAHAPNVTSGTVAHVLVDTDLFIDHLRGARELRTGGQRLSYSVVTRAELFAGTTASDLVVRLLAPFREIAVATVASLSGPVASAGRRRPGFPTR